MDAGKTKKPARNGFSRFGKFDWVLWYSLTVRVLSWPHLSLIKDPSNRRILIAEDAGDASNAYS
jgi:hypothetical protein